MRDVEVLLQDDVRQLQRALGPALRVVGSGVPACQGVITQEINLFFFFFTTERLAPPHGGPQAFALG